MGAFLIGQNNVQNVLTNYKDAEMLKLSTKATKKQLIDIIIKFLLQSCFSWVATKTNFVKKREATNESMFDVVYLLPIIIDYRVDIMEYT